MYDKPQYIPRCLLVVLAIATFMVTLTPARAQNDHEPGIGMLLIAAPKMRDPRFQQTVVLLAEHSREGTLGMILNRKTDLSVGTALPELEQLARAGHVMFFGGPVQPERVMYVYTDNETGADDKIMDGIYWGAGYDRLKRLVAAKDPDSLRIFFGYAGWGPGQLEFELSLDDWNLLPASPDHIFTEETERLWDLLNQKKPGVVVRYTPHNHFKDLPL